MRVARTEQNQMNSDETFGIYSTQNNLNVMPPVINRGWLCPQCSRAHGPHVDTCPTYGLNPINPFPPSFPGSIPGAPMRPYEITCGSLGSAVGGTLYNAKDPRYTGTCTDQVTGTQVQMGAQNAQ